MPTNDEVVHVPANPPSAAGAAVAPEVSIKPQNGQLLCRMCVLRRGWWPNPQLAGPGLSQAAHEGGNPWESNVLQAHGVHGHPRALQLQHRLPQVRLQQVVACNAHSKSSSSIKWN